MENKASLLWDKNSEVLQPLRLPKSTPNTIDTPESALTTNKLNCDLKSNIQQANVIEEIVARSTLKVDAPEWYPSNCIFDSSLPSDVTVKDIQYGDSILEKSEVKDCYSLMNNEDSPDIIRLKQIISTLTKDPGQFDNLLDIFMETLQPYFEDIIALSIIAQLLVEQVST